MSTNRGHVGPSLQQRAPTSRNPNDRLSLQPRNAPLGAAAVVSIVSTILLTPIAVSFGPAAAVGSALSIILLLFPPAILSAVYSLFFEKSKVYGGLGLLLAAIVLLAQHFTWHLWGTYLPFACMFTVFCAIGWALEYLGKR